MGRVAARLTPVLQFVKDFVNTLLKGQHSDWLAEASKVVPLPVLFRDKQKYAEVADIMDNYETVIKDVHDEAQI